MRILGSYDEEDEDEVVTAPPVPPAFATLAAAQFQEYFHAWVRPHLRRPALVKRLQSHRFVLPEAQEKGIAAFSSDNS